MTPLQIFALVLVAVGGILNYAAEPIVKRTGYYRKVNLREMEGVSDEDMERDRITKAKMHAKLAAILVVAVGSIIVFVTFR